MTDTVAPPRINVFAPASTKQVPIDDAGSYVEIKKFAEGDRRSYLSKTSRQVTVRADQSFDTTLDLTSDRDAILAVGIVGWDLHDDDGPVPFSETTLRKFLKTAPTEIVDKIEEAIRDFNPSLKNDITVEELDEQIAELTKLRDEKLAEAEGND